MTIAKVLATPTGLLFTATNDYRRRLPERFVSRVSRARRRRSRHSAAVK